MGLLPDGDLVRPSIEVTTEETQQNPSHYIEEIWSVRDAVRTRSFWLLVFGNVFSVFILMGILGHIAAWGVDIAKAAGIPVEEAMGQIKLCVFLMSIMSMAGSLIAGPLSDKIGRKAIICVGFALNAILFLYVSTIDSLTEVVIFGILAGTLGGFIVPLWAAYLGDIYGRASLATLFGILIFAGGTIGGCGPVVFGWIFDVTASYQWAWFLSTGCCLITLILVLLVKHETKKAHQL
jgi:MFS family permease